MNPSATTGRPVGVGGWLLVLCMLLTVAGPLIVAALLAERHAAVAPRLPDAALPHALLWATMLLTLAATAYGAFAGLRLWRVQPGAVATARGALLAGLVADIASAAFDTATLPLAADASFVREALWQTLPDLACFTACMGYLQHSTRVQALFPEDGAAR